MANILKRVKVPNFSRPDLLFNVMPLCLYGITPRSILGNDWWKEKKKLASIKNNHCCWVCAINVNDAKYHQRLEGFQIYEINESQHTVEFKEVGVACNLCNSYMNLRLVRGLLDKGFINAKKYYDIKDHGVEVLAKVGVSNIIKCCDIDEIQGFGEGWVYKIFGQVYESKFNSFEEWAKIYQ